MATKQRAAKRVAVVTVSQQPINVMPLFLPENQEIRLDVRDPNVARLLKDFAEHGWDESEYDARERLAIKYHIFKMNAPAHDWEPDSEMAETYMPIGKAYKPRKTARKYTHEVKAPKAPKEPKPPKEKKEKKAKRPSLRNQMALFTL